MNEAQAAKVLSGASVERFRDLIREASGLEFPDNRLGDLDRAIARAMTDTKSPDPQSLYRKLIDPADGEPLLESFIAGLTVGETYFFRNRPQFEALEHHILPELFERHRRDRRLRIWSAGCSTGEEPYSLAILIDRLLPDHSDWNLTILATDINRGALERARRAEYGPWSFRDVDPDIQEHYFSGQGRECRLLPRIRDLVTFACLNLVEDAYPSLHTNTTGMDLVLCRNVLIYFRQETVDAVVEKLRASLVDDGWLLAGHAETSNPGFRALEPRSFPGTVVYRKREPSEGAAPQIAAPGRVPTAPFRPRVVPAPQDVPPPGIVPFPAPGADGQGPDLPGPAAGEEPAAAAAADAWAAYRTAKVLANDLRLDEAEIWVGRALQRDQLHAPAHYLNGLILMEQGRLDEAVEAFRRSVYLDPDFALGNFALAGLFARMRQADRAEKALGNVTRALAGRPAEEAVPEGDGVTVGRLLQLVAVQRSLLV